MYMYEAEGEVSTCKIELSPPVIFLLLIVPRRYFCGGSYCFLCLGVNNVCGVCALCMLSYFQLSLGN